MKTTTTTTTTTARTMKLIILALTTAALRQVWMEASGKDSGVNGDRDGGNNNYGRIEKMFLMKFIKLSN
jgi:hypothetical protein